MLVYYKLEKSKYEKITKSQAEEINQQWVNVYVRPDDGYIILDKPDDWERKKKHFKYSIDCWDNIMFIFDEISSAVSKKIKSSQQYKKFFNLIFWPARHEYVKVFNIREKATRVWFIELDANKIAPSSYLWFIKQIADMAFKNELWIDREDTNIITQINTTLPMEDVIKDLSINYNWFVDWGLLFDFNPNASQNMTGSVYSVITKKLVNKEKIQNYLSQKTYDVSIEEERSKTVQLDKHKRIIFLTNSVEYYGVDAEWVEKKSILFTKWVNPFGYAKTIYDFNKNIITDCPREYFMCSIWEKEPIFVSKEIDRKTFNRWYLNKWLSYRGSETQILDFYDCLDKLKREWELRTNEVYYKNGYYPETKALIHWWEMLKGDQNESVTVSQEYKTSLNKPQITMKEAHAMLKEIYDPAIVTLSYIRMLWAMSCISFRNIGLNTPLLIVTWESQAGKSTLMSCIYELFWFSTRESSRYYSAQWLSPQPILAAAKDHVPLFIDEFTWDVNEKMEVVLRAFYDNVSTAKWRPGMNEIYEINSPLIISWERIPWFTSIVNRWLLMDLQKRYRRGNHKTIDKIKESLIIEERYEKTKDISKIKLNDIKNKYWAMEICDFDSRINESCQWILMVNNIYGICDDDTLISYLNDMLTQHKKYIVASDEKSNLVMALALANMKANTLEVREEAGDVMVDLFIAVLDPKELRKLTRQLIAVTEEYGWKTADGWHIISISLNILLAKWHKNIYNWLISLLRRNKNKDHFLENVLDDFIRNKAKAWLQNS